MATKGIHYGRKTSYTGKIVYRRKTNSFRLGRVGKIVDKLYSNDDKELSTDAAIFGLYQRLSRWMDRRGLIEAIYGAKGSDLPDWVDQYRRFITWFDGFAKSSEEIGELISKTFPPLAPAGVLLSRAGILYRLVRESFPIE